MSNDGTPLARWIAGTAVVLSGCAAQFNTSPCSRGPWFLEAGSNLVIAPVSGSGQQSTRAAIDRMGALLQVAASSVAHDFPEAKVVRLAPEASDEIACRREVVRYTWSGCSTSSRAPILISGEPVSIVWSNAVETSDAALIQFAMSNWRVRDEFSLVLGVTDTSGRPYELRAHVPISEIVFRPRTIGLDRLNAIAADFACDLFDRPSRGSTMIQPRAGCGTTFDGKVIARTSADGLDWLHINRRDGRSGWLPVPERGRIAEVFPEFDLMAMALAFQEYFRQSPLEEDRNLDSLEQALDRLRATKSSYDMASSGWPELIMGTVMLQRAYSTSSATLLDKARNYLDAAAQLLPPDPQVDTLRMLADFSKCCVSRRNRSYSQLLNGELGNASVAELKRFALRSQQILERNPANTVFMANVVAFLSALQDRRQSDVDGRSIAPWKRSLEALIATRGDSASEVPACEVWRTAAERVRASGSIWNLGLFRQNAQ